MYWQDYFLHLSHSTRSSIDTLLSANNRVTYSRVRGRGAMHPNYRPTQRPYQTRPSPPLPSAQSDRDPNRRAVPMNVPPGPTPQSKACLRNPNALPTTMAPPTLHPQWRAPDGMPLAVGPWTPPLHSTLRTLVLPSPGLQVLSSSKQPQEKSNCCMDKLSRLWLFTTLED